MFTISSFFSTFSQYFLPRLASLLPSKYINLTLADQEAKFDWINWRERDTTKVWDKFSPFLASHGVFLFGTEAYSRVPLAPSSPALSPFLPTHDQDFVYHPRPCTYHTKYLYSSVHVFFAAISDEISDALSASTLPNGVWFPGSRGVRQSGGEEITRVADSRVFRIANAASRPHQPHDTDCLHSTPSWSGNSVHRPS